MLARSDSPAPERARCTKPGWLTLSAGSRAVHSPECGGDPSRAVGSYADVPSDCDRIRNGSGRTSEARSQARRAAVREPFGRPAPVPTTREQGLRLSLRSRSTTLKPVAAEIRREEGRGYTHREVTPRPPPCCFFSLSVSSPCLFLLVVCFFSFDFFLFFGLFLVRGLRRVLLRRAMTFCAWGSSGISSSMVRRCRLISSAITRTRERSSSVFRISTFRPFWRTTSPCLGRTPENDRSLATGRRVSLHRCGQETEARCRLCDELQQEPL